jgi:5-enolpyruvylshikimate-3-phosphate synthase
MKNRETTVFSCGKQVDHAQPSSDQVTINCNGKNIETTDLMVDDVLSGVLYALNSYKDQLSHVEVEGDANIDTYFVMDALLSHAGDKVKKIIRTLEQHLGGRVYFLETLPGQFTMHDKEKPGDIAGIMVKKINDLAHNDVDMEQETDHGKID